MELLKGRFVRSLSGRDKGMILVVVGVTDEGYLLLADGKTRKLETPKKKKQKHVELLCDVPLKVQTSDGMLTNRFLKEAVKNASSFFATQKE